MYLAKLMYVDNQKGVCYKYDKRLLKLDCYEN